MKYSGLKLLALSIAFSALLANGVLASEHEDEANYLKAAYLKNATFLEKLPTSASGKAGKVRKSLSSSFGLHADAEIKGSVEIESLSGRLRLKLATQKNLLHQQQDVQVRGTATLESGRLLIYSPVEMDFWQMAKLFIDTPERSRPQPDQWTLQGFVEHEVVPGQSTNFAANLVAIGSDYYLILAADQQAGNIKIQLEGQK